MDLNNPEYCLEGSKAVIIYEQTEYVGKHLIIDTIFRIVKNPYGEYFLIITSNDLHPYIKHLTKNEAINALRHKPQILKQKFWISS